MQKLSLANLVLEKRGKVKVLVLSRVQLFVTLWAVALQAPLFMGCSRQEYWSGSPFPSPGDLPDPGIEPGSPALQADSSSSEPQGSPWNWKGHLCHSPTHFFSHLRNICWKPMKLPWTKPTPTSQEMAQDSNWESVISLSALWRCLPDYDPANHDGQGGLACCDSWGHKESDTTEQLNWTELNRKIV